MNTAQRIRIQNHLRSLALAATFFVVSYTEGVADDIDIIDPESGVPTLPPASAVANEIEESYSIDANYGRSVRDKRDQWAFQLILRFDAEVLLDAFVQSLLDEPPSLERTPELDPVFLHLTRKSVTHPPQQQAGNGTHVVFTFVATTGRR